MRSAESRTVASALYAATFIVIAVLYNLLWHHATRSDRLLGANPDRAAIAAMTAQYRLGPPLYLVAFALAFVAPIASLALCLLMAAFFSLSASGHARAERRHSAWGPGSDR